MQLIKSIFSSYYTIVLYVKFNVRPTLVVYDDFITPEGRDEQHTNTQIYKNKN